MSNFKQTQVSNFTKGSIVTSEECRYWKQLGVSIEKLVFIKKNKILKILGSRTHQGIRFC